MRYLALILILLAGSHTLPMVDMDNADPAEQLPDVIALSEVTALAAVVVEERPELRVSAVTAPTRAPVKSWLQSHHKPVVPEFLVEALPEATAEDAGVDVAEILPAAEGADADTEAALADATDAPSPTEADSVEVAQEPEVDPAQVRMVSASVLNMRAGPSSRNAIVGALSNGELALVTGEQKRGWVPVRAMGSEAEGWVFARYLGPVEDS